MGLLMSRTREKLRADLAGRSQRGAALIEAAIIMPVLLMIVFGVFEYGLLFRDELTLAQSTRDGARARAPTATTTTPTTSCSAPSRTRRAPALPR